MTIFVSTRFASAAAVCAKLILEVTICNLKTSSLSRPRLTFRGVWHQINEFFRFGSAETEK
jgi:hypothetical protein